jgi:hypothetical protein
MAYCVHALLYNATEEMLRVKVSAFRKGKISNDFNLYVGILLCYSSNQKCFLHQFRFSSRHCWLMVF